GGGFKGKDGCPSGRSGLPGSRRPTHLISAEEFPDFIGARQVFRRAEFRRPAGFAGANRSAKNERRTHRSLTRPCVSHSVVTLAGLALEIPGADTLPSRTEQ